MEATLFLMQLQQKAADARRATPKPSWRRTVGQPARRSNVRKHTAGLRDVRYGD